jgi:L-lactate dehydrogenase complex protein LldG
MSARDAILARIRSASRGPSANVEEVIRAHQCGPQPLPYADLVQRFVERAQRLASTVEQVRSRQDVPRAVAHYLEHQNLNRAALCWPEFLDLDWFGARISVAAQRPEPEDEIGITGAFCAIAETGTLMLLSGHDTPAATSLLPETHIAVVARERIVATMEDAWALLRRAHGALPRAVNFISGPSRTADIEQTVTLGAHGPARVLIVLI